MAHSSQFLKLVQDAKKSREGNECGGREAADGCGREISC